MQHSSADSFNIIVKNKIFLRSIKYISIYRINYKRYILINFSLAIRNNNDNNNGSNAGRHCCNFIIK